VIQRFFINVGGEGWMFEDGFDFRSEDEAPVLLMEVERLHTGAIAREHESFAISVPNSDGEIAFDLINEIQPTFFVKMKNCFGICLRRILMATLLQAGAQFGVVVNLAIENQPDAIGAATHRLISGG
jgi:hypothetical protein